MLKRAINPAMAEYRGNVGNLLQHWVLCEILSAASASNGATQVAFVDAYSMAPLAHQRPKLDQTSQVFDLVRTRLPGEGTPYEKAWHTLSPTGNAYPNSAAFLTAVWPGRYSLLLCEIERTIAENLRAWTENVKHKPHCIGAEVAEGDWRKRFRKGVRLSGDFAFFSFDPYMFDRHGPGKSPKPGNMHPSDLKILATAIGPISQGIVVQLSTFSANNDNAQPDVIEVVRSGLKDSGLEIVADVHANGNMMSIVLVRNIAWADSLGSLGSRFKFWLD